MQSPIKRDTNPSKMSMISAHCATIERKKDRLEMSEFSTMLNSFVQDLNAKQTRSNSFVDSMNQIMETLNSTWPRVLTTLQPHDFLLLVRTTIHKFLQQILRPDDHFHEQELFLFRNNVLFLENFLEKSTNLSEHVGWLADNNLVQTFAECLHQIKRLMKIDPSERLLKQMTRLLKMFSELQERFIVDSSKNNFLPLFEGVVECLKSKFYWKSFQSMQSNTNSLSNQEKFFLIRCPHFLTSYQGSNTDKGIKEILDKMLPRYALIFDQHMKTIKVWHRPIMRALHNLLTILIYSEDRFATYINEPAFRSLIHHFLTLIDERTVLAQIRADSNNIESLLMDAVLIILTMLVSDAEALKFIQQSKSTELFRQLTFAPRQTIVLNAYMMMAYTIDEEDIKKTSGNFGQLFLNIADVLSKNVKIREGIKPDDRINRESVDRNIMQLIETLKGLVQHDSLKTELYKTKVLPHLLNSYYRLNGFSKQLILEGFWTLAFNKKVAHLFRSDQRFLSSLKDLINHGSNNELPRATLPRTASFQSIRSAQIKMLNEEANQNLKPLAIGLLLLLNKEQHNRSQKSQANRKNVEYDFIISSYYTDRKVVDKIYEYLSKQGFRIWYDQIDWNNDVIDKLSTNIDSTGLILVCISDAFKRDNYCRTLIELAAHQNLPMLPVIVHHGSKVDGWLNSIVKSNLTLNITASNFETSIKLLAKEIQHQKKKYGFETSTLPLTTNRDHPTSARKVITNTGDHLTNEVTRSSKVMSEQHESERSHSPVSHISTPTTSSMGEKISLNQTVRDTFDPQRDLPALSIHDTGSIASRIISPPHSPASSPSMQREQSERGSVRNSSPKSTQTVLTNEREEVNSTGKTSRTERSIADERGTSSRNLQNVPPKNEESDIHSRTASTVSSDTTISAEKQSISPPEHSTAPQSPITNEPCQSNLSTGLEASQSIISSRAPDVTLTRVEQEIKQEPQSVANEHIPSTLNQQNLQNPSPSTLHVPSKNSLPNSGCTSGPDSARKGRTIFRSPMDVSNTSDASFSSQESDSEAEPPVVVAQSQPTASTSTVRPIYPTVPLPPRQQDPPNVASVPRPQALIHLQTRIMGPNPPSTNAFLQKPAVIVQPPPPKFALRAAPIPPAPQAVVSIAQTKSIQQKVFVETVSESDSSSGSVQSSPVRTMPKVADMTTLPKAYTNRNTTSSNYRTLSVNAWTSKDVLDFLFDHKLYAMMPLCELMAGAAFIRFYQMAKEASNQLFDHLNKELSSRFNGLLLPSSIYTQFLVEMNKLIGSMSDDLVAPQPPKQKIIERVILKPTEQQTPSIVTR